jgi:hypothetical protein
LTEINEGNMNVPYEEGSVPAVKTPSKKKSQKRGGVPTAVYTLLGLLLLFSLISYFSGPISYYAGSFGGRGSISFSYTSGIESITSVTFHLPSDLVSAMAQPKANGGLDTKVVGNDLIVSGASLQPGQSIEVNYFMTHYIAPRTTTMATSVITQSGNAFATEGPLTVTESIILHVLYYFQIFEPVVSTFELPIVFGGLLVLWWRRDWISSKLISSKNVECTAELIAKEKADCDDFAKQNAEKLEWLEYTSKRLAQAADRHNKNVEKQEKALADFQKDLNSFITEFNDYKSVQSDMQAGLMPESGDDRLNHGSFGGAGGIYQVMKAWQQALETKAGELTKTLNDLQEEYKTLAYYAQNNREEQTSFKKEIDEFVTKLEAFLKGPPPRFVCTVCDKVIQMIKKAKSLPFKWPIKDPTKINDTIPSVPQAPNPPQPPQPIPPVVPIPGVGKMETKCYCKVTHKEEDKPLVLKTVFSGNSLELGDLFLYQVTQNQGPYYVTHPRANPNPCLTLFAKAQKLRTTEITVTREGDESNNQPKKIWCQFPLGPIKYEWQIDDVKITDAKLDNDVKDVKLKFELEGKNQEKGQKIESPIALIRVNPDDFYFEWFEKSGASHFEGKLIDFELSLKCTASVSGDTVSQTIKIKAEGKKAGEPGKQTDYYHFSSEQSTASVSVENDLYNGQPIEPIVKEGNFGEFKREGGLDVCNTKTSLKVKTVFAPDATAKPLKLKSSEPYIWGPNAQSIGTFHVFTEAEDCKNDEFTIEIPLDTSYFETFSSPKIGPDNNNLGVFLFQAPVFEKEMEIELLDSIEFPENPKVEARLKVTVLPFLDIMDWWRTSVIWDAMAQKGIINPEDKQKMLVSPRALTLLRPELWNVSDLGFQTMGLAIKDWRRIERVKKVFRGKPSAGLSPEDLKCIAKRPYYYFQFSENLPPQFAAIPAENFDRLHPEKRVIEWVAGQQTLGDILMESTGPDYFYKGATPEEFERAVKMYAENVRRIPDPANPKKYIWVGPPDDVVREMTRNVRYHRIRQAVALRCNELIRLKVAQESGKSYTPRIKVVGEPRIYINSAPGLDQSGKPYPSELTFEWQEETKIKRADGTSEPRKFKITIQVETELEQIRAVDTGTGRPIGGFLVKSERIKKVLNVANFLIELDAPQKAMNNDRLREIFKEAFKERFPNDWEAQLANFIEYEKGGIGYPKGGPFPPKSVLPLSVEDVLGEQLAVQSIKVWGIEVSKRIALDVWKTGAFSAGVYFLVNGFGYMIEGFKKEGVSGALKGFCIGFAYSMREGGKSALLQVLVGNFGQSLIKIVLTNLETAIATAEKAWVNAFLTRAGLEAGAIRAGEISLYGAPLGPAKTEILILTGKLPLLAAKLVTRVGIRLVPLIGMIPIFMDINTYSKEFFEFWNAPPSDEDIAWKDPLRTISQVSKDDALIVQRGIQVRTTGLVDSEREDTYYKFKRTYTSLIEARATKITFKDGSTLEIADEIVDSKSEFLPKIMRDRLPDLPNEIEYTFTFRQPAFLATLEDVSYLGIKDEAGLAEFKEQYAGKEITAERKEIGKIDPYQAAQNPSYFAAKVNREIESSGVPNASDLSLKGLGEKGLLAYREWGLWRDKYATKWTKVERLVPGSGLVRLVWWRDFTGAECTVIETRDNLMIMPQIDFEEVLKSVLPPEDQKTLNKEGIFFTANK